MAAESPAVFADGTRVRAAVDHRAAYHWTPETITVPAGTAGIVEPTWTGVLQVRFLGGVPDPDEPDLTPFNSFAPFDPARLVVDTEAMARRAAFRAALAPDGVLGALRPADAPPLLALYFDGSADGWFFGPTLPDTPTLGVMPLDVDRTGYVRVDGAAGVATADGPWSLVVALHHDPAETTAAMAALAADPAQAHTLVPVRLTVTADAVTVAPWTPVVAGAPRTTTSAAAPAAHALPARAS